MRCSTSSSSPRPGFTLVELLVVIAIIGVLVALLLPAVQAAREAARRMQCQNNFKQIGIALHNHHDTFNRFPPGGASDGPPFGGTAASGWGSSWMVYLLPFIEQNAMNANWQFSGESGIFNANNQNQRRNIAIPGYVCPSSPLPKFSRSQNYSATSNYVGIAGAVTGLIPNYTEARTETSGTYGITSASGVLFPLSQNTFASITDGSSNTLVVGEMSNFMVEGTSTKVDWRGSDQWGWSAGVKSVGGVPGSTPTFYSADNRPFNMTTIRYRINLVQNNWSHATRGTTGVGADGSANVPLHSAHPSGCNGLLGDGSVRFLTQTMTLDNLARLATRDDGQVINEQ